MLYYVGKNTELIFIYNVFIALPVRHSFRVAYGIISDVSDALTEDGVFFKATNFQSSTCMVIAHLVEKYM